MTNGSPEIEDAMKATPIMDTGPVVDLADSPSLREQTIAILTDGGALFAAVDGEDQNWTVSASFPCRGYADDGQGGLSGAIGPKAWCGNTRRTGADPRDMARAFVADAAAHCARMEAFFGPSQNDEQSVVPRETEDEHSSIEVEGDFGAEMIAAEDESAGIALDETLRAEPVDEPQAFAGSVIMGADPLDRQRSQRMGDVARIALERAPVIDNVRLTELRNFAMGVSEGRWPDDSALQVELQKLEVLVRLATSIDAYAKGLQLTLMDAPREVIEAFDPNEGWPE